ncbi:PEP-CTERM sorting domain-containing protein [Alteromonas sp. ASW11-19]|uniref:PEP-CTERM sorting domain-containing protein n=1 Tax=Alteromonas salexigens TaxID=2982530 RepID=A0ABT2VP49_9ALTE|nr:PEP-CTERM sorting domain-containing protein [Alteromonas salexigens]MCU7554657.1 PEP-CTERM sorting domain-containing protein [Alteromonas salexigens]
MKFNINKKLSCSILLAVSAFVGAADAALITETYQYRITEAKGSYLANGVGDLVTFTATFNDTHEFITVLHNNGEKTTHCSKYVTFSCDDYAAGHYPMMSDIDIRTFESVFEINKLTEDGGRRYDSSNSEYAFRQITSNGLDQLGIRFNHLRFTDTLTFPEHNPGQLSFKYTDRFGRHHQVGYGFEKVSYSAAPASVSVSSPATIALAGLGLMGIGLTKRRKN